MTRDFNDETVCKNLYIFIGDKSREYLPHDVTENEYLAKLNPGELEKILQAGLLSASGRSRKPWEFVVVQEKETLEKLSHCRVGSAKMLENAGCAIVVFANPEKTDVWVEDCSIVMSNMHLMADSLGLGSCWIQGRLRETENGEHPEAYNLNELEMDKIHYEGF